MHDLYSFKKQFDIGFRNYLEECVAEVHGHFPEYDRVTEHFLRLAGGGKRLRPYIFNLAYHSAGGESPIMFERVMFGIELFQLFAIIHDDITDGGAKRHGVETLHKRFNVSQAILFGDLCFAWAIRALSQVSSTALCASDVSKEIKIFSQMATETIIGQIMDTSMAKKSGIGEDLITRMVLLKSAKYTFVYPILLGLSCAGYAGPKDGYTKLGLLLGESFQRINDLADIMSEEKLHGTKLGADVTADVPTNLLSTFEKIASSTQKEIYSIYRGQPLDDHDIAHVRELFIASGAVAREKDAITTLLVEAERLLFGLAIAQQQASLWQILISLLRSKVDAL